MGDPPGTRSEGLPARPTESSHRKGVSHRGALHLTCLPSRCHTVGTQETSLGMGQTLSPGSPWFCICKPRCLARLSRSHGYGPIW